MAILKKISINKKKEKLKMPEEVQKKISRMRGVIIRNFGINLVIKIINAPLDCIYYPATDTYKEFEEIYKLHPEAVHYRLSNGENLIEFAYKQRKLGMLFSAIQSAGLGEIAVAKFGEKEPLCFALFETRNLTALEEMDKFLRKNRLNPKDENGNTWSEVYYKTYGQIRAKEAKMFKQFQEEMERNNNEFKYYNRELK